MGHGAGGLSRAACAAAVREICNSEWEGSAPRASYGAAGLRHQGPRRPFRHRPCQPASSIQDTKRRNSFHDRSHRPLAPAPPGCRRFRRPDGRHRSALAAAPGSGPGPGGPRSGPPLRHRSRPAGHGTGPLRPRGRPAGRGRPRAHGRRAQPWAAGHAWRGSRPGAAAGRHGPGGRAHRRGRLCAAPHARRPAGCGPTGIGRWRGHAGRGARHGPGRPQRHHRRLGLLCLGHGQHRQVRAIAARHCPVGLRHHPAAPAGPGHHRHQAGAAHGPRRGDGRQRPRRPFLFARLPDRQLPVRWRAAGAPAVCARLRLQHQHGLVRPGGDHARPAGPVRGRGRSLGLGQPGAQAAHAGAPGPLYGQARLLGRARPGGRCRRPAQRQRQRARALRGRGRQRRLLPRPLRFARAHGLWRAGHRPGAGHHAGPGFQPRKARRQPGLDRPAQLRRRPHAGLPAFGQPQRALGARRQDPGHLVCRPEPPFRRRLEVQGLAGARARSQ